MGWSVTGELRIREDLTGLLPSVLYREFFYSSILVISCVGNDCSGQDTLNNTPAEVTDMPVCRKYFRNKDMILQVILMCGICVCSVIQYKAALSELRGEWCVRIRYTSLGSILSGKRRGLHLFDEFMLLPF